MRILAIAPTGFFADYGCHVRIRGQMAALAARGHQVRIATYPSGRDVDNLPTVRPPLWPRHRPLPVGSSRRKLLLDTLLAPTALAAALVFPGGPPHVVHAYLHEGALMGRMVASLLKVPLVFDFQGSLTAEMVDHRFLSPQSTFFAPLRRLEHWIDRQPDAILASSEHAVRLLVLSGAIPSRVHNLPDSVDPAVFRPRYDLSPDEVGQLRLQLQLPPDRPVVAYLGLLAPYQGTDLLIHAVARLVRQGCMLHCVVMGFPDVERYRQLAKQCGVSAHVTFTGAVAYEDAPLYLALGDVAVAPKISATEGSGKLLTYMAAGLPVVAFDTPVHREYLGDLGIYAPSGSADGLAKALGHSLRSLAESPERGQALRARVIAEFTWDHAAVQIEAVYRGLIAFCRR